MSGTKGKSGVHAEIENDFYVIRHFSSRPRGVAGKIEKINEHRDETTVISRSYGRRIIVRNTNEKR